MERDEMEKLAEEKAVSVLRGFKEELLAVHGVDLGPKPVGPIIGTLVKRIILSTLGDDAR